MAKDQWFIRGVDEATKRAVRVFAAQHDITMAEALKRLVEAGEKALQGT